MHRAPVCNIFPFLEEQGKDEGDPATADADDIKARIHWLQKASIASQEEFALRLMSQEPEGEAFNATWATVLTMKKSYINALLKLEKAVCAKKIEANRAHIKKIYARYSIAIIVNRAEQRFDFKFPHKDVWDTAGEGNMGVKLAESGFPLTAAKRRCKETRVPASATEAVEQALRNTTVKRAKRG